MKKAISIMLVCAALASSGAQAVFAEEPMVISAKNEAISILVDGKALTWAIRRRMSRENAQWFP